MKSILELRDERTHAVKSADDITHQAKLEDRNLTAEEAEKVKEWLAVSKTLEEQIVKRQEQQQLEEQIQEHLDDLNKPEARKSRPMSPRNEPENEEKPKPAPRVEFMRYARMNAFENTPEGHEKAYRSGMWLRAKLYGDERANRWCVEHGVGFRSQQEADPIYGGNLVPDEMAQTIIDNREKYGVFRQYASIMPMGRDMITIPKISDSLAATFTGEETALTEDEMKWVNVNLVAKKAGILIKVSSELAEDAIVNLADIIATDCARAFALKEDQCGFIGTGTSTYGGIEGWTHILREAAGLAGGVVATSGDDQYPELIIGDIHSVMGVLPAYARPNAKWFMSTVAWELAFSRMMAAAGGNTTMTLAGKIVQQFLGYPVIFTQALPTTTAAQDGAIMFLFGDLSMASVLGDRRGIAMKVSTERYMEYDQIGITATTRFDIANHGKGDATTAGAIVGLNGNT